MEENHTSPNARQSHSTHLAQLRAHLGQQRQRRVVLDVVQPRVHHRRRHRIALQEQLGPGVSAAQCAIPVCATQKLGDIDVAGHICAMQKRRCIDTLSPDEAHARLHGPLPHECFPQTPYAALALVALDKMERWGHSGLAVPEVTNRNALVQLLRKSRHSCTIAHLKQVCGRQGARGLGRRTCLHDNVVGCA